MSEGGWTGKILRVDLSKGKHTIEKLGPELASNYLGGRGFAAWMLWNELNPGTDPLAPENKLILATGPLTGFLLPSSGKMVVAAKSPLTKGYGDGNIGTRASVQMKKAGYDMVVMEGRAEKPSLLHINDGELEILSAESLWGKDTYEAEELLEEQYGKSSGILLIGPAGERLVKFAVIVSERGRSGGRPGMGAVMGSKNLKAIIVEGSSEIPAKDPDRLKELGRAGYQEIKDASQYGFWIRQGTMATIEWSNGNSVLPTHNFKEGVFEGWEGISGETMEKTYKVRRKGCPNCNMQCGNICEIKEGPYKGETTEVDYENIAMLGSNLGIDAMEWVLNLNLLADKMGVDTISLGSSLGFAAEAYSRDMISKEKLGVDIKWGDGASMFQLARRISLREGFGDHLAEGVREVAGRLGRGAEDFAMHVKGLEISAYDCHAAPGMALAFATSSIGAHHKDAWFIVWEMEMGRDVISREKVERLIEMQRIRAGFFESLTTCRLPWIELGFSLDWYPKYLEAATGMKVSLQELYRVSDRIFNLIRAFWVRENPGWTRQMDCPPKRWFGELLTQGPLRGTKLSEDGYDELLGWYYEIRGWDQRGIPRVSTLEQHDLGFVADQLQALNVNLAH